MLLASGLAEKFNGSNIVAKDIYRSCRFFAP
jgi:hypothetical protein